jgi:NAD(P)-dependent dehydrogenase (short-subunit alcohol dehydrogenase family)
MPLSIEGKNVVVVGASSGIGAATARMANAAGAKVILVSRGREQLEQVRLSLVSPELAMIRPANYLNPNDLDEALSNVGRIDHVCVSAVADENKKRGKIGSISLEAMKASFDKFWGQINVVRAALPYLADRASITLFSSVAGISPPNGDSGLSVMNGVQAAVIQTGRSLARELAPRRVNIIAPGVVLTNVWTDEQRDNLSNWMTKELPAQHAGEPEDIAQAALFLMTNPYVTGIILPVDGGLLLQ